MTSETQKSFVYLHIKRIMPSIGDFCVFHLQCCNTHHVPLRGVICKTWGLDDYYVAGNIICESAAFYYKAKNVFPKTALVLPLYYNSDRPQYHFF